ncbi:MAG: glycosyltransferase, partial [Chitinophagaceae bacterium]
IAVTQTDQWVNHNAHTRVWYAGKQQRSQHLIEQVELVRPDVLYIIGLFNWHFNIVPLLYARAGRKLLSVRGMLHPGALSQKPLKKKVFLQLIKWMGIEKRACLHATDQEEMDFIKNVFPAADVLVAGNFPRRLQRQHVEPKQRGELKMVSVGIISPMKNYALVLEALQTVKATLHYTIYGPVKEPGYWETCLALIQQLPAHITVSYQKELPPHKVPAKLQGNHVFILPSISENYGHAIAEALSAGLPVITSNGVPWLGLAQAGAGVNVNGTVSELKEAIEFFADMEMEELENFSAAACRYIETKVDVAALRQQYATLFAT